MMVGWVAVDPAASLGTLVAAAMGTAVAAEAAAATAAKASHTVLRMSAWIADLSIPTTTVAGHHEMSM